MNRALLTAFLVLAASVAPHPAPAQQDPLAPFFQKDKLRALILSGRNNHDWRSTTPFLKQLLLDCGRFDVRVAEATDGLTEATLVPYDVLIMDYGGPSWGEVTEKAIESLVRSGKGFVSVHGASYHFSGLDVITDGHRPVGRKEPAWPAFRSLVGCGWDAMPAKGYHGPRHTFPVKITEPDHPIVKGLGESFLATDELYHGMTVVPGARVIATAFSAPDHGGTGKPEPMLVVSDFGKGRCFYTALGHETPAMWEPGFRSTFLRGVEWAASGKVTLPPDAGGSPVTDDPVRVLVVTGGHDYDPSFYTIFEGAAGIRWRHALSNQEAFRANLRASVDVLVLYDLSQDLDATGRRNLQDFVESNKGLVVLHHALADYSSWEWWWKEVVGGRYVLKAEPDYPGSTYLHDQWVEVTPAIAHPVVGDLGPMRFLDETYKQVWHAPGIQPLLMTTQPSSDDVIAWISPWKKSRVVAIQPGHDQQSHRHPAYRKLVLNAILWSASKRG